MGERTEILSMFERGYESQSGHEKDDACWLDAALKREAAFEEEASRAMLAGSDPDLLGSSSPTICFRCGVSFHTKDPFTYGVWDNIQP